MANTSPKISFKRGPANAVIDGKGDFARDENNKVTNDNSKDGQFYLAYNKDDDGNYTSASLYTNIGGYILPVANNDEKMDKVNPTATGYFSMNQVDGTSKGDYSFAIGKETKASGTASFSNGIGTVATSQAQTVIGEYNIEDSDTRYLLIAGNGTEEERSNALILDRDGNLSIAGDLTLNMNGDNPTSIGDLIDEKLNTLDTTYVKIADLADTTAQIAKEYIAKKYSTAGTGTTASTANQLVIGSYNVTDDSAVFIIGNGTESATSNAFIINNNGQASVGSYIKDTDYGTGVAEASVTAVNGYKNYITKGNLKSYAVDTENISTTEVSSIFSLTGVPTSFLHTSSSAPGIRFIAYGTTALTAGESYLPEGVIYFQIGSE